jgi:hypothetical protein
MSVTVLIEAVEWECFCGGVVAAAFGDVQVASVLTWATIGPWSMSQDIDAGSRFESAEVAH